MFISLPFYYRNFTHLFPVCYLKIPYQPIIYDNGMDFIYPLLVVNNNVNTRKSFILQLSLIFQIQARTGLTGKKETGLF